MKRIPNLVPPILLVAFFVLLAAIISPCGNFPLNDDWGYSEGVRNLLQEHRLYMPTACAPGFFQVFLGTALCSLTGFSCQTLRCLAFFICLLGTLALYGLLRNMGLHKKTATIFTLIYAGNPIMINIFFSFMSDAGALNLTNIYFYFLSEGIKRWSKKYFLLSIFFLIAAISCRQSCIIFSLLLLVPILLKNKEKKSFALILLPGILLAFIMCFIDDYWLVHRINIGFDYARTKAAHATYIQSALSNPAYGINSLIVALGQLSNYLGLFTLPILIPFVFVYAKRVARLPILLWQPIAAAVMEGLSYFNLTLQEKRLMPFSETILRIPTIGASTIMGIAITPLKIRHKQRLTIACGIASFVLITALLNTFSSGLVLLKRIGKSQRGQLIAIALLSTALSMSFLLIETNVRCTDRYYLIALAPLLSCLALTFRWLHLDKKVLTIIMSLLCLLICAYSICANADYMNWNRARWQAINKLETRGISYKDIDGGYEYNTVRGFDVYTSSYTGDPPHDKWRWWPIRSEKYIISFSPIPDYDIVDRVHYFSPLSFSTHEILVLKKPEKQRI